MVSINEVYRALNKVKDPELGVSITKMHLVDNVKVADGTVIVDFHLATPFSPSMFAKMVSQDIKERLGEIGIRDIEINQRRFKKTRQKKQSA